MELKLKYYEEIEETTDIKKNEEIIKKYKEDFTDFLKKDSSWEIYYNYSNMRKNALVWYPFKKNCTILEIGAECGALTELLCEKANNVTSIDISKNNCEVNSIRNKDKKNLEIIAGNLGKIKVKKKFDYVILNGILANAGQYVSGENPQLKLLEVSKKLLNKNGKILITIDNKYGLKYWCGTKEENSNLQFEGINSFKRTPNVKTLSKIDLETLFREAKLKFNFYYMFPDYRFTKVIYTDKYLEKNNFVGYSKYSKDMINVVADECILYKEIFENKMVPFFANSYFIELSDEPTDIQVEFVKFNNDYRNNKTNLYTYYEKNKYVKATDNTEGLNQLKQLKKIYEQLCNKNINTAKIKFNDNNISIEEINGSNLDENLKSLYKENNKEEIFKIVEKIYEIIKNSADSNTNNTKNNIFEKYGIKISEKKMNEMNFYKNVIVDIAPSNIIQNDNNWILIDQEWIEECSTLEYSLFRTIQNINSILNDEDFIMELYDRYNIDYKLYSKVNIKFIESIKDNNYKYIEKYYMNFNPVNNIVDQNESIKNYNDLYSKYEKELIAKNENFNKIQVLDNQMNEKNKEIQILKNQINEINNNINLKDKQISNLTDHLNLIVNSKGYKMLQKAYKIKDKIIKK